MKLLWIFLLLWVVTLDDGVSAVFWKPKQRSYKIRSRPPNPNHPPPHFQNSNVNLHGLHSMTHSQILPHGPPPQNHGPFKHGPPPKNHHGPPPNNYHGPLPPKSYNTFPGLRFPKPSSSNIHRLRLRPPPHLHHGPPPGKSYRPKNPPPPFIKNFGPSPHFNSGPSQTSPTGSGSSLQNSFNTPSESPPSAGGVFHGHPENFKQSEIPSSAPSSPSSSAPSFFGSPDNFIRPSKEYPSFPPPFLSNSLTHDQSTPHYETIGLSTSPHHDLTKIPHNSDKEHGWTAATYKGWRPISKPPSYYIDRQKKQQQQAQEQQQHHTLLQQQSQAFPVSYLPPSSSSSPSTKPSTVSVTTEEYRDVGGKHQKMMLNTLFRDNVKHIKPQSPVKLKPDFTSQDQGVIIPLPDEVGSGIRIPTNIFFDDFGRAPTHHPVSSSFQNQQQSFPRPYPHPENHKLSPTSSSPSSNSQSSSAPLPPQHLSQNSVNNNNLAGSQSEESPVRKPFPKFRPSNRPANNDSNSSSGGGSSENSSPETNTNTVLNKFKSNRPKFQRRPTHSRTTTSSTITNSDNNNNEENNNSSGGKDDADEVGPPKINNNNNQQSSTNVKEKINKGRTRVRTGQNGGGRKPDGFVGTEEVGQVLQNPSSNNNNESPENGHDYSYPQRQPGPPYPDLNSDIPPPPPPPTGLGSGEVLYNKSGHNFNFPPPPYNGFFDPPPPNFYDSHFMNGGGPDNFIGGPPVTTGPSSSDSTQNSAPNNINPNKAPRAGPNGGHLRKKKPKPHSSSNTNSNTYNNYNPPSSTAPPAHHHPQQQQQQQPSPQSQQQQVVFETNTVNTNNNNNNNDSPFTSQQGFFIPPEFTQIPTGNGPHQPISFMTMPGSKPNVIRHNYDYSPQQQQQPHPPPSQQQQIRLQHQSNQQHFQHEPSPVYPINILSGPNFNKHPPQFSPSPSSGGFHNQHHPHPPHPHSHHHHHNGPFPSGPYTPVPAGTMPHHQRQKIRPSFETTTLRNSFTSHPRPGPPPPPNHHNEVNFSPQYPPSSSGHEHNGEVFQRQPTNSYKLPVLNSNGPKKFRPGPPPHGPSGPHNHHNHPHPPPPPPHGPFNRNPPPPPPPPPHTHTYSHPSPNSLLSSSEQYEQIPHEFMNHLRPILMNEGDGPLTPSSSTPFSISSSTPFSTSSMRPSPSGSGFLMSSTTNRYRHAHQSPEIHPPSQYFDEFFKPFQDSYPAAATHITTTTDKIPQTSTFSPRPLNGHPKKIVYSPQVQSGHITIPKPKIPLSGHFDSHKSPSVNFEQFLRPHIIHDNSGANNNNGGIPGRRPSSSSSVKVIPPTRHHHFNNNNNMFNSLHQNDIGSSSSDPLYSIAPIHDFSVTMTTTSPIQDFDLFFNSRKPQVWSKLKGGDGQQQHQQQQMSTHHDGNDFGFSSSSASTENYYLPPAASTSGVTPSIMSTTSSTTGHGRPTILRIKDSDSLSSQEIRATHRPIFKPKPLVEPELEEDKESATTFKPLPTTMASTSSSSSYAPRHKGQGDEDQDNKDSSDSDLGQQTVSHHVETSFSSPIQSTSFNVNHHTSSSNKNYPYKSPVYHHPRLTSTVATSSSVENENEQDDLIDSSIPNTFHRRRPSFMTTTTTTTSTTPAPTTTTPKTTTNPDDQSDSTSTFTSKRYLRRRKPGLFGGIHGVGHGRKRFFSSKLNQTTGPSGPSGPSFMSSTETLIDHKIDMNDPPVTTHRPLRKYKPTSSGLIGTTTQPSTSTSNEEIVTQPFVYPRKRLLQKRKQFPPAAARLGLPVRSKGGKEDGDNGSGSSEHKNKESHEIIDHNNHKLDDVSKTKFTGHGTNGASSPSLQHQHQQQSNLNMNNILTSLEVESVDKNDHQPPQKETKGGGDTTPNSAVTYGESQWFRLVNNNPPGSTEHQLDNEEDGDGEVVGSEEKLKKRATSPHLKVNQPPQDPHGNLIITSSSSVSSSSSSSSSGLTGQQQQRHKQQSKNNDNGQFQLRHRTLHPETKLVPLDSDGGVSSATSSEFSSGIQHQESLSGKFLVSRPRMLPAASPLTQSLELDDSSSMSHDDENMNASEVGMKANSHSMTTGGSEKTRRR